MDQINQYLYISANKFVDNIMASHKNNFVSIFMHAAFICFSLLDDFEQAAREGVQDDDTEIVAKSLHQSRDIIVQDAKQLSIQITGRLASKGQEQGKDGAIAKLVAMAKTPHFSCYVTAQGNCNKHYYNNDFIVEQPFSRIIPFNIIAY